jgi:hypothetical protein
MIKTTKFLLLILLWTLFGNWNVISSDQTEIVGKWHSISNNYGLRYDFRSDNQYTLCNADSSLFVVGRYEIFPDAGIIKQYIEGDTVPAVIEYKFFEDKLILMQHKAFKNQISHLTVLKNDASKIVQVEDSSLSCGQQIVLPMKYRGNVFINYNQKDGQVKEYTYDKRPLISIPANGLLQTQFPEEPYNFILGRITFSIIDTTALYRHIKFFSFDKYYHNLNELFSQGYDMDSVYVCTYGYNRQTREEINKLFDKTIEGNVMMFRIDTLKNLISNPFSKSTLNN